MFSRNFSSNSSKYYSYSFSNHFLKSFPKNSLAISQGYFRFHISQYSNKFSNNSSNRSYIKSLWRFCPMPRNSFRKPCEILSRDSIDYLDYLSKLSRKSSKTFSRVLALFQRSLFIQSDIKDFTCFIWGFFRILQKCLMDLLFSRNECPLFWENPLWSFHSILIVWKSK